MQETANFDVLYAYLTSKNYDHQYDISKNLLPHRNIIGAMRNDVTTFAAVQKDGLGLDVVVEKAKQRMARYHVTPNMLVMAPETQLYVTMVPSEKRTFNERGERGPADFDGYNGNVAWSNFRGLDVFTSNPFDTGDNVDALQMLRRNTQVGEFYVMRPPPHWDDKIGLPSNYMDILIFDESKDRLSNVSFKEAMKHAMPWETKNESNFDMFDPESWKRLELSYESADLRLAYEKKSRDDDAKLEGKCKDNDVRKKDEDKKTRAKELDNIFNAALVTASAETDKAKKLVAERNAISARDTDREKAGIPARGCFACPPAVRKELWTNSVDDYDWLVELVSFGIWVPFSIIVARPFIEHSMLSAVMTVAGSDTGNTLFGPADMQLSANTTVKVLEGHYTMHSKAVITKHQNCLTLADIQCDGYIAGSDVKWFGDVECKEANLLLKKKLPVSAENIAMGIRTRLDFEREDDNQYGSMLAFACTINEDNMMMQDSAFSLTDGNLPWDVGNHADSERNFPGGKTMFDKYKGLFNLDSIHAGRDPSSVSNREFVRNGSHNNGICLLGPHRSYSPLTARYFDLTPGQGHFGPDALPGVRRLLNPPPSLNPHTHTKQSAGVHPGRVRDAYCAPFFAGRALAPRRSRRLQERQRRAGRRRSLSRLEDGRE